MYEDLPTARHSAQLYRDIRARMVAVAADLDGEQAAAPVPACPKWTVRDLFAHLAGVAADVVAGNLAGATGERWTQAQLDVRAGRSLAELLDEWEHAGPGWERIVLAGTHPNFVVRHPFLDAGTHEADLYGALGQGRPPAEVGAAIVATVFPHRAPALDCAVTVHTAGRAYPVGAGAPTGSVRVDDFELSRALFGRRTAAQIRGWEWTGDPGRFPELLPITPHAEHDLAD